MVPNVTINQVGPTGNIITTTASTPPPNSRKAKANAKKAAAVKSDEITLMDNANFINNQNQHIHHNRPIPSPYHPSNIQPHQANPEMAKRLGNEILQVANHSQVNAKYTCMPVTPNSNTSTYNSYNDYNNQQSNQQPHHNIHHNQQYQSTPQNQTFPQNYHHSQNFSTSNNNYTRGMIF